MRFTTLIIFMGCMLLQGCMQVVPYGRSENSKIKEYEIKGHHFIYLEHSWSPPGIAIMAGHGGVTTSSNHVSQEIDVPGLGRSKLIDRVFILQQDKTYKPCSYQPGKIPWHKLFYFNGVLYLVLLTKARNATDIPIQLRYPALDDWTQFIGEWDPKSMKFLIDRYFPDTWDEPKFYLGPPTSPFDNKAIEKVCPLPIKE